MEKIDFVITWVDGNDKKWQLEKNKYKHNINGDNNFVRYREWDNLQYWFRGVEKFAPWVNKIYFVTWGHIPNWLNTNNPKLKVITHSEFIPKEYLPTFSSHTIELNLHRIKGLSEKFVYFNDDTFIINNVKPSDFFKNNLPCDSAIFNCFIPENYNSVTFVGNNDISLINNNFNKKEVVSRYRKKFYNYKYGKDLIRTFLLSSWTRFPGFVEYHLPNAYLKSTFEHVWKKEYDVLHLTCLDKFRNVKTNVNQWVMRQWQIAEGNFIPRSPKIGKYFNIYNDINDIENVLIKQKYKLVCLNDSDLIENFEEYKLRINKSFKKIMNEKSSFEK